MRTQKKQTVQAANLPFVVTGYDDKGAVVQEKNSLNRASSELVSRDIADLPGVVRVVTKWGDDFITIRTYKCRGNQ